MKIKVKSYTRRKNIIQPKRAPTSSSSLGSFCFCCSCKLTANIDTVSELNMYFFVIVGVCMIVSIFISLFFCINCLKNNQEV